MRKAPHKKASVDKPINEWSFGRTVIRILIYPFCLFLIVMGFYMILHPVGSKSKSAGVGAIVAGAFYLYLDLKIILSKKRKV